MEYDEVDASKIVPTGEYFHQYRVLEIAYKLCSWTSNQNAPHVLIELPEITVREIVRISGEFYLVCTADESPDDTAFREFMHRIHVACVPFIFAKGCYGPYVHSEQQMLENFKSDNIIRLKVNGEDGDSFYRCPPSELMIATDAIIGRKIKTTAFIYGVRNEFQRNPNRFVYEMALAVYRAAAV